LIILDKSVRIVVCNIEWRAGERRGEEAEDQYTEIIIYIIYFKHIVPHWLSHSHTVTDIEISDYDRAG